MLRNPTNIRKSSSERKMNLHWCQWLESWLLLVLRNSFTSFTGPFFFPGLSVLQVSCSSFIYFSINHSAAITIHPLSSPRRALGSHTTPPLLWQPTVSFNANQKSFRRRRKAFTFQLVCSPPLNQESIQNSGTLEQNTTGHSLIVVGHWWRRVYRFKWSNHRRRFSFHKNSGILRRKKGWLSCIYLEIQSISLQTLMWAHLNCCWSCCDHVMIWYFLKSLHDLGHRCR